MRLKNGLKIKGGPAEIPDCSRDDLPQLFLDLGFKTGAEIGVDKGDFSEKFLKRGLNLYAVDAWLSYDDYTDLRGQKHLDSIFERTKRKLNSYPNCTVIRKTSMKALNNFKDRSLDFIYLDSNHQFKYVAQDLYEWSKKVKKGGIISGHDYIYTKPTSQAAICHVIYVVNAFVRAYGINNWYLLGRGKAPQGEIRDKWRSWMWINP